MSGIGEASLVLGLISSTITIFEAAQEVYEAASDAKGLPKKFRVAAEQIPLVHNALSLAEKNINARNVAEEALQNAKPVLERCKESAASVKDIFDKTIPSKDASRTERYKKAVGIKIKSSKVKEYMEEICKNMELLARNQVFQDAEVLTDIKDAIEQLNRVPDEEEQPQFVHSGTGAINANTGAGTQKNYNNSGSGRQYNAEQQTFHQAQDHGQMQIGDHNVTYNFQMASLTSQLPQLPPPPSAVMPFRRDRDFVERPLLDDILQRAAEPGTRVGLVGLGGVGKSQLAIEYAYRVRELHPDRWVFWVHASSATRFEESYRNIAGRLRLPGWNEPKANLLGMVHGWLSDDSNSQWTLVVDNADDATVMFEPDNGEAGPTTTTAASTAHTLSDFLPLSAHGSIVITSRNREVVERLQVFSDDILDVEPMEADLARTLLLKKLKKGGREAEAKDTESLVKYLDCMPLAITQAAAYIEQTAPRMTVVKYMAILETNESERATLLQRDVRDSRRDRQASNSIIMTWHVTFTHLRQTRDSAARLLALMSLFDREAIPDHLLQGRYVEGTDGGQTDFEDDVATLRAYSLISIGVNEALFDMHRLVQLSTQKWLEIHTELRGWQKRYIDVLGSAFPKGDYTHWTTCQTLFPHVEAMERYYVTDADHLLVWARTLFNGDWYATTRGQYRVANRMARASLAAREETLDVSDVVILDSADMLALVLRYQGKYEEAESMNRRALAGYEKELGVDHPSTLTSVSNLASVLQEQGKYKQAEAINRRALAGFEKVLGVNHPSTLTSVTNLAAVLYCDGKYEDAEAMNRRALAGREKELGVDHPNTLTSVNNLALVLQHQGKYKQAEEMYRRTLAESERELGADHPDTLTSASNLASVLRDQEKYAQAEVMNRQALAGFEKVLGIDHPDTLRTMSQLAQVLRCQGKYEQADAIDRKALAGYEKVLGVDHPDTLTSGNNLAIVLQDQGNYQEAEALSRRALAGREKVLGVDHPDTLTSVTSLAVVLYHEGKYEEAEAIHRRALAEREKVLGVDHPDTLTSVEDLALVLYCEGKYNEAEVMIRRTLAGREKVLGTDHPDTLTRVGGLASVLLDLGKYEQAEAINRRALAGREKVLGVDHPDTLTSLTSLAAVLYHEGKYEEAETMSRRALAGREKVLGVDHPDTLTNVTSLASVLYCEGKYEEAEVMIRRTLAGREKVLGADHPDTLTSVGNLASALQDQGKYEQAEEMYRRALAIRKKILGEDHLDTAKSLSDIALVLMHQKKYKQTEEMQRRALAGYSKVLGANHPTTVTCQEDLASLVELLD